MESWTSCRLRGAMRDAVRHEAKWNFLLEVFNIKSLVAECEMFPLSVSSEVSVIVGYPVL